MYYFHLQFKQPDVLVLMCDFKSISQVYQHSSPFSVQGSISLWPPALTHPGVCPEHPTAARLDWDLGNEEAKSNTSHCCWLSLTWNGQYDLRTGYPDHFTCRRSGCCVWSVNSGIWKSHVSSHLSVHSRFGLNNSIGVKVQCVSQVSPLHEFFSFAWIQHRQTLSKCSWTCCCCFLHQHNIKENIKTMTHSTLNRFTSVFFAVYYYRAVERFWVDMQQDDKCRHSGTHLRELSLADCHGVQTCVHGEWSHVHAQTHRPASCLHKQSFLWGSGSQAHVCTWNFPAAVEETSVDASGKRHKREKGIKSNMKRKKT